MNKIALIIGIVIVVVLVAGGVYLEYNKPVESIVTKLTDNKQVSNNELKNYGAAPELVGIYNWLNSEPLTLNSLRGQVVLIDFWTYSCINCIRTLPYVTKWYDTYKDNGFVIIGVHTPEFAFEKDTGNVAKAIKQYNIHYPVAQDNDFSTWRAFNNHYWPAKYLIDQSGNVVYYHFGEGDYDITEKAIRTLLDLEGEAAIVAATERNQVGSPEMYFGIDRQENLTPAQKPITEPADYSLPTDLKLNNFGLGGSWQFTPEAVSLVGDSGQIKLKFKAGQAHMVGASQNSSTLKITVDGQEQPPVEVTDSQLYTLFSSDDYNEHIILIEIGGAGFEAYTFTFG